MLIKGSSGTVNKHKGALVKALSLKIFVVFLDKEMDSRAQKQKELFIGGQSVSTEVLNSQTAYCGPKCFGFWMQL